jgi:hypothetical protein
MNEVAAVCVHCTATVRTSARNCHWRSNEVIRTCNTFGIFYYSWLYSSSLLTDYFEQKQTDCRECYSSGSIAGMLRAAVQCTVHREQQYNTLYTDSGSTMYCTQTAAVQCTVHRQRQYNVLYTDSGSTMCCTQTAAVQCTVHKQLHLHLQRFGF